jgi:hypothetical protein
VLGGVEQGYRTASAASAIVSLPRPLTYKEKQRLLGQIVFDANAQERDNHFRIDDVDYIRNGGGGWGRAVRWH